MIYKGLNDLNSRESNAECTGECNGHWAYIGVQSMQVYCETLLLSTRPTGYGLVTTRALPHLVANRYVDISKLCLY